MMRHDTIEVVQHGPLHRARTYLTVRPGSPYRSMFLSSASIVVAWGFSAEGAAERCKRKCRRRHQADEAYYAHRESRTRRF